MWERGCWPSQGDGGGRKVEGGKRLVERKVEDRVGDAVFDELP